MSRLMHFTTPVGIDGNRLPLFDYLAGLVIWCCWRIGPKRSDGRFGKLPIPCRRDGLENDGCTGDGWNNAANMVTLAEALAFAERHGLPGVGLVVRPEHGLVIGDLDHAVIEKRVAPWARAILAPEGTCEVYAETSPSGLGARFICRGRGSVAEPLTGVELFDGSRVKFCTITGAWWKSSPDALVDGQAVVDRAMARADKANGAVNQGGVVSPPKPVNAKAAVTSKGKMKNMPLDVLRQAMAAVSSASVSRDDWRKFGLGLHHEFDGSPEAFAVWDEWSAADGRYVQGECETQWRAFGEPRDGNPVTARVIVSKAQKAGWKQPHRDPGAAFGPTDDDEPEPLDEPATVVPPMEWVQDAVAEPLEDFAVNAAKRCGGDVMAALGLLVMVPLALIPAGVSFEPRGEPDWRIPATVYAALVGHPGSTKSPLLRIFFNAVTAIEAEWYRAHRAAVARHERAAKGRADGAKGRREAMKAAAKAAKAAGAPEFSAVDPEATTAPVPDSAADLHAPPTLRRRTLTTATPEGHAKLVESTNESIIIRTDELQSHLGTIDKYNRGGSTGSSDRPYWTGAYEGDPFSSGRAGEDRNINVHSLRASIFGGTQPDVIGPLLAGLSTDGLAQRYWWLPIGPATMSERVPLDERGASIYATCVRLILDLGQDAPGCPIILTADAGATEASFDAERLGLELQRGMRENDPLRSVALKTRGAVARLTLGLHVLGWAAAQATMLDMGIIEEVEPLPLIVSEATARAGLALWERFFWRGIVSVHRTASAGGGGVEGVRELAAFISGLPKAEERFTAWAVGQKVNRWRTDKAGLERAAAVLERKGWIRREADAKGLAWAIHPKVPRAG